MNATTPLGLERFNNVGSQGSCEAQQPWAKLHNRFAVPGPKAELLGLAIYGSPGRAAHDRQAVTFVSHRQLQADR